MSNDTAAARDTQLVITRVFDAPRELVYRAFTDPVQLSQWFAPVGYSVPAETVDMDVRVGGHQRFTMVADDGSMSSAVSARFTEVVENVVLAGAEDWVDIPEGLPDFTGMQLRVEFHDEPGDKTRVVLSQGPYTQDWEPMARAGWESSFTKLDALLAR